MNQTFIFNTTERTAVLKEYWNASEEITTYDNVPTVKIENGYYEVMQKLPNDRLLPIAPVVPVLRVPIANTNMIIKK